MTDLFSPSLSTPVDRTLQCVVCGSSPAVPVRFDSVHGVIIFFKLSAESGPFCRDCGLSTFRRMTGESLLLGWWSWVSVIVNPIYLITNLLARRKVARLAPPSPPLSGDFPPPQSPGRPLFLRVPGLIFLGVLAFTAVIVTVAVNIEPVPIVGRCVAESGTGDLRFTGCDSMSVTGVITSVETSPHLCPESSIGWVEKYLMDTPLDRDRSSRDVLCIGRPPA